MNVRILAALLLVGTAATAGAADSGFYFGAAGGKARYDFEPIRPPVTVIGPAAGWEAPPVLTYLPPTFIQAWSTCSCPPDSLILIDPNVISVAIEPQAVYWLPGKDDEATTWSVQAGYRFSRYLAAELAYHNLGTLREYQPERTLNSVIPVMIPEMAAEMESRGASFALVGQLPLTDLWSIYVRAGGLFVEQEVQYRSGTSRFNDTYDSEVLLYGLGTQVDLGKHWSVRLDFQRFDDMGKGNGIGQSDTDALTLNVLFRLGAH